MCVCGGPGRDMATLESADSFINELIKWVSLTSASCRQGLAALAHLTHVFNKALCHCSDTRRRQDLCQAAATGWL